MSGFPERIWVWTTPVSTSSGGYMDNQWANFEPQFSSPVELAIYVRADLYAALQPVQCVTLTMEEADLVLRHYHQAFDDHGQADDCFLLMARIESEYLAWAETQGDVPR